MELIMTEAWIPLSGGSTLGRLQDGVEVITICETRESALWWAGWWSDWSLPATAVHANTDQLARLQALPSVELCVAREQDQAEVIWRGAHRA